MKITRIETIPVDVPIEQSRATRGARDDHVASPFLLVKLHTDEGFMGLGEVSCTPVWSGEDRVTAARVIASYIAPALVGEDPARITHLTTKISRAVAGNPFTKAGIEMALWDLLGKVASLPLYQLFGGAVRDVVPTKYSVSGLAPDRAAEIARWAVEQGFTAMKVKVGLDPDEDIARVRAVREAIGPSVCLGVDANGGWLPRVAKRTIERLQSFDIAFVEQPIPAGDVAWLADVRSHTTLPIVADESISTPHDALALVQASAADVFSIYVGKGSGIAAARQVAAIAGAAGLVCTVGSNLELGIGNAAMIHLAVSSAEIAATDNRWWLGAATGRTRVRRRA